MVHARTLAETTYTFIVSGKLWRNSMTMQDEQTGSLWSHVTGLALDGALAGRQLQQLPAVQTTWAAWVQEHPTTVVLKENAEILSSRYATYFADPERTGIFRAAWLQDRLPGKTKINGITRGPFALAITQAKLPAGELLNLSLADEPLVAYHAADGGVRAFLAQTGDAVWTFQLDTSAGAIKDEQTQSTWDLTTGDCVQGKLKGMILEAVPVMTAYWFAWSGFYPNTEVVD